MRNASSPGSLQSHQKPQGRGPAICVFTSHLGDFEAPKLVSHWVKQTNEPAYHSKAEEVLMKVALAEKTEGSSLLVYPLGRM